MAELILDITAEFDAKTIGLDARGDIGVEKVLPAHDKRVRRVVELSRYLADEAALKQHALIRHPEPRETIIKSAIDALTGQEVLLVATRWIADGPRHS